MDWLGEWACSRSFGLGTRIPWDEQFVIESLSDSTIYMSFYTIAHLLQGGTMDGSEVGPLGIRAEDLDDAIFEYVFCKAAYPEGCVVPQDKLDKIEAMLRELGDNLRTLNRRVDRIEKRLDRLERARR